MSGIPAWVQNVIRDQKKDSAVEAILSPRIAMLKNPKVSRPDMAGDTHSGLMELADKCPHVFGKKAIADALIDLLKWSSGLSAPRDGIMQHQLACALLLAGHENQELWPTSMVQAYLLDALDRRMWVDLAQNSVSTFVANILTAFPGGYSGSAPPNQATAVAKEPDPKRMRLDKGNENSPPLTKAMTTPKGGSQYFEEEDGDENDNKPVSGRQSPTLPAIRPRFRSAELQNEIAKMAQEAVRRQMEVLQDAMSGDRKLKSLIRVLTIMVCYEPVRNMVVCKLDSWLANSNLTRYPRELLSRLAASCTQDSNMERETMRAILRMRPKANQTLVEALATVAKTNVDFLDIALRYYLDIEMFPLENKTLKNKVEITTIFRNAGAPHLSSDRPKEHGGVGSDRHPTLDSGLGQCSYQVRNTKLVRWDGGGAGREGRSHATLPPSHVGALCVALESELLSGTEGDGERLMELSKWAAVFANGGAAGLIVVLNAMPRTQPPRNWRPTVNLPVVLVPPGEKGENAAAPLLEAAQAGYHGEVIRTPRELILAFNFKMLAVDDNKRVGLCPLARKLLRSVPDMDPVVLCQALMEPQDKDMANYHVSVRRLWALVLVDLVIFVCFHIATHAQEIAQAPMHADRGAQAGQSDLRVDRAMSRLRSQVRQIQQHAAAWAATTLPQYLPPQDLVTSVEKLLFILDKDKVTSYNSDTLTLEASEKSAVQLLINDMPVTLSTLGTLISLALPRQLAPGAPPSYVGLLPRGHTLDMLEVMVTRAASVAAKRHGKTAPPGAEWIEGDEKENLDIAVGEERVGELIFELTGFPFHGVLDLGMPKRFWQACRILVLLSAFNTSTLGRVAWQELPTIRSLLLMLITGRFAFPASGDGDAGTEAGKGGDTEMADAEAEKKGVWKGGALVSAEDMAELEAEACKRDALRVEAGIELVKSLELSENDRDVLNYQITIGMTVNPRGPPRQPPPDVIEKLQEWDRTLNLGHILRMSRTPDMLIDTIKAHGSGSAGCVEWLGPVLDKFPSTLSALPEETLCQLLLANLAPTTPSTAAAPNAGRQKEVERVVQRLAGRLAGKGEAGPEEGGKEGGITALLFFVDLVGGGDVAKQDTAVQALNCILEAAVKMGEEADESMEEAAEEGGSKKARGSSAAGPEDPSDKGRWLRLLMQLPCPPQVRGTLSDRLRSALFTETDAMLLHHYLIHLSKHLQVGAPELADDVARLVLERRVQVAYLARLEGARETLQTILLEGLRAGKEKVDGMVEVAGGVWTDKQVVRAALNSLCLPTTAAEAGAAAPSSVGQELRDLVLPLARGLGAALELSESDMMLLLQCADSAFCDLGIDTASSQHLVQALRLFGPSADCLAGVVRRLKQEDAGPALAARVGAGSGARVAAMLSGAYEEEAQWLAKTLKISVGPAKRLQLPTVARLTPGLEQVKTEAVQTGARAAPKKVQAGVVNEDGGGGEAGIEGLRRAVQGTGLEHAVGGLEGGARGEGKGLGDAEMEAAVLMDAEERLRGLQVDLLSAVNPLCGPRAVKVDARIGRMLASVFGRSEEGESSGASKGARGSPLAAVASTMVRLGLEENLEGCVAWMLKRVAMELPHGEVVYSDHEAAGPDDKAAAAKPKGDEDAMEVDGQSGAGRRRTEDGRVVIDARLLLDVLSVFVLRVSQPVEGCWDEGGGSDVKETLTRRESRRTWVAGGRMGTEECMAAAELILCEPAQGRDGIAVGRMAVLLGMLGARKEVAQEVGEMLLGLLEDGEADPRAVPPQVLRRAGEMADRLSMALPLVMAPIESQRLAARKLSTVEDDDGAAPAGLDRLVKQTARLDRLVQLVITSLQQEDRAASAVVVARQVARAHPRLMASHMLSLRAVLAGNSMLRPTEFAQRNCSRLFIHVIGVIEAAAPHSLASPKLGAVLDELLGIYKQTVRYEAVLQPLLGRAAGLLLMFGQHSREGWLFVKRQSELLATLAAWYVTVPELQRLLEFLSPSGTGLGFGLGLQETEDRDAELLAAALRMGRGIGADSTGSAHQHLTKALEEAEMVTKGEAGLHRLVRLERPLLDLLAANDASVRDAAYRLVLRLGMQQPEAALRLSKRHLTALNSPNAGAQCSAITHAPEVALLCASAAPSILTLLLRLARDGSELAKEHLLRATRAGLVYHCQQAR